MEPHRGGFLVSDGHLNRVLRVTLVKATGDGTFTVITDGLNRPTSLEFIGSTAYVVTFDGEIWKLEDVSDRPNGGSR